MYYWEQTRESGKRGGWAVDMTPRLNDNLLTNEPWKNGDDGVAGTDDDNGYTYVLGIVASNVSSTAGLIFQGEVVYMDGSVEEIRSGVTHQTLVFSGGAGEYDAETGNAICPGAPAADTDGTEWYKLHYEYDETAWKEAADQGAVPNAHISNECVFYDEYSARYTLTLPTRETASANGGKATTVQVSYSADLSTGLRKTELTGHVYTGDSLLVTVPVTAAYDDTNKTASFTFTVPDYIGTGDYDFRLNTDKIALLNEDGTEDSTLCTLTVTQPTVSAAVGKVGADSTGNVYLTVNGERTSPVLYLPSAGSRYSYDKNVSMQESGVTLYTCFEGGLSESLWLETAAEGIGGVTLDGGAGFVNTDLVDEQIYKVLNLNPDAYLIYNITAEAPEWWKAANSDAVYAISAYDETSGQTTTVSFASEDYRNDCGAAIKAITEHIIAAPYANRVVGIRLSGGRTAEWMHEVVKAADGSTHQVDLSPVMIAKFNELLTEKGLSTVDATGLKAALAAESDYGTLLDLPNDTALLYNQYLSQTVSETILHFAAQVKTASNSNMLTGAYNGYSWSSNTASVGATHSTVELLLESDDIDFISAPADYSERITGYKTGYMALSDSVKAHGKLFMVEQDNRTVYMTEIDDDGSTDSVGHTDTVYDGVKQLWRDFTTDMVNGVGFWGYDMLGGWYDDPAFTELFAGIKAAYDDSLDVDTRSNSQVAVWLDNNNFDTIANPSFSTSGSTTYALFKQMHVDLRKELAQLGTSYDVYAIEDVADTLSADELEQYKVHLVVSPFQLSTEERTAINEKLKVNGNTVVWVYLPGFSQDNAAWSTANIESLTDFAVTVTEKTSAKISTTNGTNINDTLVPTVTYGGNDAASPRVTVTDGTALATYTDSTDVSVAYTAVDTDGDDTEDYTSVYSAAPHVPVELLRAVCADAGVHLYAEDPDLIVETNESYIAVNSLTSGEKTITLPEEMALRDVLTGTVYSGTSITLDMDAADTVLLMKVQPEDTWDAGLIPNGSFEDNGTIEDSTVPNGWTIKNVVRSYEMPYGDSWYSLKGEGAFYAETSKIDVEPETIYTLSFSYTGGTTDVTHTVRANCYDTEGNAICDGLEAFLWVGNGLGSADEWQTVTVSFKTTANTDKVGILFNAQAADTEPMYWDNFSLFEHEHTYTDDDYLCDTVFPVYRPLEENTGAQPATKTNFVCAYDNETPEFTGAYMTLGEELKLLMSVDPHGVTPENITVKLNDLPDYSIQKQTEFTLSELPSDDKGYYVSIAIPAAHMHKEFTATLYANGVELIGGDNPSQTYSAVMYATEIINGATYTDEQKAVAKSMLNYGAWAQMYFGVDRDNLANAGLDDDARLDAGETAAFVDKIVGIPQLEINEPDEDESLIILPDGSIYVPPTVYPIDAYKATTENKLDSFIGYSLLMRENSGIRLYFESEVEITLNGVAQTLTADTQSERYYLEMILPADKLTDDYTVTAAKNGVTMTIEGLSVLTPARTVINSTKTSENYKNVCVALILYAEAVYTYAGSAE